MVGFVKNLDVFSNSLPSFNIDGKTKVNTWMGAVCSIIIFILTSAFGLLKLQHLVTRRNPAMSEATEQVDADATFSLDSEEFTMAFAIHRFAGEVL